MKIDSLSSPWPSEHPEYNYSDSLSKHCLKEHFSLMLTFPFFHPEYPQMFSEHAVYVMLASDWREHFFSPIKKVNKLNEMKGWTPGSYGIGSFHHHLTDRFREVLLKGFERFFCFCCCFWFFCSPHTPDKTQFILCVALGKKYWTKSGPVTWWARLQSCWHSAVMWNSTLVSFFRPNHYKMVECSEIILLFNVTGGTSINRWVDDLFLIHQQGQCTWTNITANVPVFTRSFFSIFICKQDMSKSIIN